MFAMPEITKIHTIDFADVFETKQGSKHQFKIPSFIDEIVSVALFITNPVFCSDDVIPPRYNFTVLNFFTAVEVSLLLFNENNSILEYLLANNEFLSITEIKQPIGGLGADFKIDFNMDLAKIEIPINKENLRNSYSTIVFKKAPSFDYHTSSIGVPGWKPNVRMIIKYK